MTDRAAAQRAAREGQDCPTKSTPAARPILDAAEAMPQTKTSAGARPGSVSDEASAPQRLPTQFGRYRLIRELGRGGMGTVVLAEDTQLARQVALKIPFLKKASDTRTLKRFEREAKAAASLSHPNLCQVYDFGTFDNHHFLSMAYIEGKPLQAFLNGPTEIPQRTAAGIIRKIAQALQHAHERGVIHRDLKPSNIMIDPNLGPIVTDFGLARCLDDEGEPQLTADGVAIGTPSYMSPEQLDGDSSQIGPQSDIFSLGLILFEMLTGQRRFQGKVASIIGQILTKDPGSLREIRKEVDPQLDGICRKMMARNPAERYASMAEVAGVMRAYLKGELSTPARRPVAEEMPSDPEPFFLGLPSGVESAVAPSTQGGGWAGTQAELVPAIQITDQDSVSSRILPRRANPQRTKSPLFTGGLVVLAALLCFALFRVLGTGQLFGPSEPEASPATHSAARQAESSKSTENPEPAPKFPGLPVKATTPPTVDKPVEAKTAENVSPAIAEAPQADLKPAAPMPIPPPLPAKSPTALAGETIKLKAAKGKPEFHATVTKTINGSLTEKKFSTPRSALSELSQLERRQTENDKALEQLQVLVVLNENAFEFAQAKPARELITALDEAIPLNVPVEEMFAKLEYLNPKLADAPPISLSQEDSGRLNEEVQKLFSARTKQLQALLFYGRVSQPQEEVDKAQALFEQDCQKLKGMPKNFPLPKFRIPWGTTSPLSYKLYTGDAERFKDQSPRGQVIKRIAAALNEGTLTKTPAD